MPSTSAKQHRFVGELASSCPHCEGIRVWKHAKADGSTWRQYCTRCHGARSYEARKRRRIEYNARLAERRRSDPKFKAYEIWKQAKDRATMRGIEFSLSRERVERAVLVGRCEVTGLRFSFEITGKRMSPLSPSIDRINPNRGYVVGNVQIVCWLYNRAKGDGAHEDVMMLVEALNAIQIKTAA